VRFSGRTGLFDASAEALELPPQHPAVNNNPAANKQHTAVRARGITKADFMSELPNPIGVIKQAGSGELSATTLAR
jgi:hypothetical protein